MQRVAKSGRQTTVYMGRGKQRRVGGLRAHAHAQMTFFFLFLHAYPLQPHRKPPLAHFFLLVDRGKEGGVAGVDPEAQDMGH